uniref:Uncharacterized protein n=1 Tax=Tanacetum cinerariifolium TaxID=118510 RepID=A0A699HP03_TANCI|nr:hypothetical protein [Tanacetum cinerariifolium]
MTSFGYHLNPRYAIKECLSCGALYTEDFCCSKGNVEDRILVPKLPKNYARCARCGQPVNGSYCQGCTLLREKLEEDLVTYFQNFQNTSESSDGSTNVVKAPREPFVFKQDHGVNPPHIDECCCECGNVLDGIYCQQCICKFCGKGAHIGYNCPPKVPIISNPEPCNQTMNNEPPQTLPSFDSTVTVKTLISHKIFTNFNNSISVVKKQEDKRIEEERAANAQYWKIPACCDDDDYNFAITPVLPTEEPVDSLSIGDEHLDTIPATESDEVIKSSVENLVPIPSEFEGIPDTMCDMHLVNNPTLLEAKDHFEIVINPNDDISSSDDDSLYNENIKDNPTSSSEFLTKSSSTSSKSFLEETYTFHNSLPEFENFYLDLEEISSSSTTTHSDISLPDYKAFYFDNDHIKEISGSSTTTHSDISLSEYDSFIFDLSNDQCPPTDRSDFTHEEFANDLAHIISLPKYECFYFRNFPDPDKLMSILNSRIRENLSTTSVNLPVEDDHSPLLTYVVWIIFAYLAYPVIPPYLHSFGNEDTIFDPGITINRFYSFKPGLSHQYGTFKKFNTHRSHLNEGPMMINEKNTHILDVPLFHFYPP